MEECERENAPRVLIGTLTHFRVYILFNMRLEIFCLLLKDFIEFFFR